MFGVVAWPKLSTVAKTFFAVYTIFFGTVVAFNLHGMDRAAKNCVWSMVVLGTITIALLIMQRYNLVQKEAERLISQFTHIVIKKVHNNIARNIEVNNVAMHCVKKAAIRLALIQNAITAATFFAALVGLIFF